MNHTATLVLAATLFAPPAFAQAPAGGAETVPRVVPSATATTPTPASATTNEAPTPYVREIWTYNALGRTDPMHPPSTLRDGSNLPQLAISGILLNTTDPSQSRVAFRLPNGERVMVAVGDTVPPFVITKIEANRVEVRYPQLGGIRQRWIERPKPPAP